MTARQWRFRTVTPVFAGLVLAALDGCGGSKLPAVVPVTGSVSHQGKPLAEATVSFFAKDGKSAAGGLAFGVTDAAGHFQLRTQVGRTDTLNGVVPGEYRVTISKLIPPQGMTEEVYRAKVEADKKAGESAVYGAPREIVPPRVELLPAQYSNAQQTTLSAVVEKKGKNDITLELK